MKDMLRVGVITTTHGLQGEVKVFPTTDDSKRFKKLKNAVIRTKKEDIEVHVEYCKFFKNIVILKFKEFNHINEVECFRKCDLLVSREHAVPLKEGEYFICDIIGADVYEYESGDNSGRKIGELMEVLQTGANDVYVVKLPDGKEVLFPVIPECVKKIDTRHKIVEVIVMNGLME